MTNLEHDHELCAICLEDLRGGGGEAAPAPYTTECGHCFHRECLERAYRMRPCCPYCRGRLTINEFGGGGGAFHDHLNDIIIDNYNNIIDEYQDLDNILEQVVREMHQNNDINHILEEHYNREYNNIYFYAAARREQNEYVVLPLAGAAVEANNNAAAV